MRSWWILVGLALLGCSDKNADDTASLGDDTAGGAGDRDGDGVVAELDCDDTDVLVYPGSVEYCDAIDNNCDGRVDEGYDGDGDGVKTCEGDCADYDASISPLAEEISYDGIDQDCSGADQDDLDGDGYVAREAGGADCDDTDPAIYPGVEEVPYDGIDQDCARGDLNDLDGDGVIGEPAGGTDCDDTDASIFPGNPQLDLGADGIDSNCDGQSGTTFSLADSPISVHGDWNSFGSGYPSLTGNSLESCDLDGDGLPEMIVSVPFGGYYAGAVAIWLGSTRSAWGAGMDAYTDADILIEDPGSALDGTMFLGFGLVCSDVSGDGQDDLVVGRGEISYSTTYVSDFSIYLFLGGSFWGSRSSLSSADADAELVYPLGVPLNLPTVTSPSLRVADLDGDGTDELLIDMNPAYTSGGVAYEMENADGLIWRLDLTGVQGAGLDLAAAVVGKLTPGSEGSLTDLTVLPDGDGDGLPDVLVGQGLLVDSDTGLVPGRLSWLGAGTAGALSALEQASVAGADSDELGYRFVLGDFDGDGYDDLVVSALLEDSVSQTNVGALYLFSDFATGLSALDLDPQTTADAWLLGEDASGYLGYRLANMGDVSGDGADDVLVVELYGSGWGSLRLLSGAALVGEGTAIEDATLLRWEGEVWTTTSSRFGIGLEAVDLDGDGLRDFVLSDSYADANKGRVYAWLLGDLGL